MASSRLLNGTKIEWHMDGFEDVRRLPGVEARIQAEVAKGMGYASAGAGYAGGTEDGGDRVRGYIYTFTFEAMLDQARNATLQRALGGTGGFD